MKVQKVVTDFYIEHENTLYVRTEKEGKVTWFYYKRNLGEKEQVIFEDQSEKLEQEFNQMVSDNNGI